jgi:hypothetical protein
MINKNTPKPKEVNEFVRNVLLSIYGDAFPDFKIPCARTYSEAYNKDKSWRYKWYFCFGHRNDSTFERMVAYTNEVLNPRMQAIFQTSVKLKWNGESLTLLAKPVK